MSAARHIPRATSLAAAPDRPLIGIVMIEDGREVTRYFIDEADLDAAVAAQSTSDARPLAGAWSDLDWEETIAELNRIRHGSAPTPPIDDL